MSLVRLGLTLAIGLGAVAVPLTAQEGPLKGLDDYAARAREAWEAPGVVIAVVRNDSVVLVRGYGVRELGKPDPVDGNTLFAVASTTKAFTAALLGMLVDQDRITWDDPVTKHLPGFQLYDPYASRELTVRDLLTHRSGLSRADRLWAGSGFSREEILRRVRYLKPSWSFRARYGYQNVMFLAAGELAGRVMGLTWDDAVRTRIFEPLGMARSRTSTLALRTMENVAIPHEGIAGRMTPVAWPNYDNVGGAGAINSSASDMAQWVRLQLGQGTSNGRRLLEPGTVKEMQTIQTAVRPTEREERLFPSETHLAGYGLGWRLRDYRGYKAVSHGGSLRGMRTQVLMLPEIRLGAVLIANFDESRLGEALGWRIIDQHLGRPVKDWSVLFLVERDSARARAAVARKKVEASRVAGTVPSLPLERYTGTYADSLYGSIEVVREGAGLAMRFGPDFTGDLTHWHYDTFETIWRNPAQGRATATFRLNAEGQVAELEMDDLGVFGRVPPPRSASGGFR
jgi:CubicO group peptidase (beta-lactamase class C family)